MNRALNLCTTSLDLGFERGDAFLQLLHRIGVEVLPRELKKQVVLATRKIFVGVHHAPNVDPAGSDVNNAGPVPIPKATTRCACPK
jgi:hypothetical protein